MGGRCCQKQRSAVTQSASRSATASTLRGSGAAPRGTIGAVTTSRATPPAPGRRRRASLRNFCIIAHIDHGKSTLADRMLQITGVVDGRVHARAVPRPHGHRAGARDHHQVAGRPAARSTPPTAATYVLNLIDTPGHVDFTYEVSRSLAACEGAVLLVDAAQGIEAQTLANLLLALENDLTVIPVLNKIDLPAAQPEKFAAELAHIIGCSVDDVLRVTAKTGEGVEDLLNEVVAQIPPPTGDPDAPARAHDLRLGLRHLPRGRDLRAGDRRRVARAGTHPDDVDTGRRTRRSRSGVISPEPIPTDYHRRRRGRLPDHRGEGRPAVPGR